MTLHRISTGGTKIILDKGLLTVYICFRNEAQTLQADEVR